ncbi:hypothetical protein [[Eubacterium] cellulosolvens]
MERTRRRVEETFIRNITYITFIIGILVIGLFLRYLLRAHRGILGLALGGLSIALLIYWLGEIRKQTKIILQKKKDLDALSEEIEIIKHGSTISVAGRIPGPPNHIKVWLEGRKLKIVGGSNYRKELRLKEPCRIENYTYKNGILEIKLTRSDITLT